MKFSYSISTKNNLLLVSLNGDLIGKEQVSDLWEEIDYEFENGAQNLLVDLAEMQYMNSTGLSILINFLTKTRNKGGDVIIVNVPEKINKLLVITKLNSVFNIKNDKEQAITELTKAHES